MTNLSSPSTLPVLLFILSGIAPILTAADCSTPIDPNKDFFGNFVTNSCYVTLMSMGQEGSSSDLNALYSMMGYKVDPNYNLVIAGTFSESRFLEVQGDDSHAWPTAAIVDQDLLPLLPSMVNPFLPGAVFVPNQLFAVNVLFGDMTATPSPGCGIGNETLNVLDVRSIHQSGPTFVGHKTGPNTGGSLMIRRYVNNGTVRQDAIIVRSTATGCAIPAAQALSLGILVPQAKTNPNRDQAQVNAHYYYGSNPQYCFTPNIDPASISTGRRNGQYIPDPNAFGAAYVGWPFSTTEIQQAVTSNQFFQVQFKAPTTPATPCSGCMRTGNEQLRYFSLSFDDNQTTLLSLSDKSFNTDLAGNITLVVNVTPGLAPPVNVTRLPYTYVDLSQVPNWHGNLSMISVRNIAPNSSFYCSTGNVPPQLSEWSPGGGYMGTHGITVTHFRENDFPVTPAVPARNDASCLAPQPIPAICP